MPVTISITESDIFRVLGNFITLVLPNNVEVIQGQINRTPEPTADDWVVMTSNFRKRLATDIEDWDKTNPNPTTKTFKVPTQATIQVDFHGPNSPDYSSIVAALFRSSYACDQFKASNISIQPLYVEDPKQVPFINGAQQYEDRWTLDAQMQINPILTVSQEFADQASVGVLNVDASYPPGG